MRTYIHLISALVTFATLPDTQVFQLFNLVPFSFRNVAWGAVVHQAPTMLALVIVCAFGTSMDIMAVQAEVPYEIDNDAEVSAVGLSNVAAGLFAGGGTGAICYSSLAECLQSFSFLMSMVGIYPYHITTVL
jgi:MFS superfamily sulfate permease-like transporter